VSYLAEPSTKFVSWIIEAPSNTNYDELLQMNTPKTEQPPRLLDTKADAARFLGLSLPTVNRMVELNQVPVVRIGDRDMIRHADLVALVGGAR
jgi:hypothetical protein